MGQRNKATYFRAYKGDAFSVAMANFTDVVSKLEPEKDTLNAKKYSSSDLNISRRTLSHWRKLGLLEESDTTKLSFIECFWLTLANELRSFGVPLENVKKVKDIIFNPEEQPLLAFYIYHSRQNNEDDFFLIVNAEGDADIGSNSEIKGMEDLGVIKDNYIKINFNHIWNKLTKSELPTLKEDFKYSRLDSNEKKILDAVRNGKYKKLAIRFKNGIATHLEKESVETRDALEALKEAVSKQSFGTITLTQQDGKVIHMKNIATEKL